jgi:hypothetical protein
MYPFLFFSEVSNCIFCPLRRFYIIVGVSMSYNFQTTKDKNKTLKAKWKWISRSFIWQCCIIRIFFWEKIWRHTSKWHIYFVVSGLKIISYRNFDNNLESFCIMPETKQVLIHHYHLIRFCMSYVDEKVSLNKR